MKEKEMEFIAHSIAKVTKEVCAKYSLPEDKAKLKEYLATFRSEIKSNPVVVETKMEVTKFCEKYPLYKTLDY